MQITVTDKTKELDTMLAALEGTHIEVGIFKDASPILHERSKMHPAKLLAMHENPPEGATFRPRPVLTASKAKITKVSRKNMPNVVARAFKKFFFRGRISDKALYGRVPSKVEEAVKSTFGDTSLLASNMDSTVKRKGFDKPMVETGSLQGSIEARVIRSKKI